MKYLSCSSLIELSMFTCFNKNLENILWNKNCVVKIFKFKLVKYCLQLMKKHTSGKYF